MAKPKRTASRKPAQEPTVSRWAVDSCYSEHIVRMEVCRLKADVKDGADFEDDLSIWGEPECVLVTKKDFRRKMDIPSDSDITFDSLEEGRVYLLGAFDVAEVEVVAKPKRKARGGSGKRKGRKLHYQRKARKLGRIDRDTRKGLEDLYMSTLRRR